MQYVIDVVLVVEIVMGLELIHFRKRVPRLHNASHSIDLLFAIAVMTSATGKQSAYQIVRLVVMCISQSQEIKIY